MKILYFIQRWRKESLIKRLTKTEVFLNKELLRQNNEFEKCQRAYAMLSSELYTRSIIDPNDPNSILKAFMLMMFYPSNNMFGNKNIDGKSFLEDVLKKTKEEVDKKDEEIK